MRLNLYTVIFNSYSQFIRLLNPVLHVHGLFLKRCLEFHIYLSISFVPVFSTIFGRLASVKMINTVCYLLDKTVRQLTWDL